MTVKHEPLFTVAEGPDVVEQLHAETRPIPGRAGWRVDDAGREWYSAAWVDEGAWNDDSRIS